MQHFIYICMLFLPWERVYEVNKFLRGNITNKMLWITILRGCLLLLLLPYLFAYFPAYDFITYLSPSVSKTLVSWTHINYINHKWQLRMTTDPHSPFWALLSLLLISLGRTGIDSSLNIWCNSPVTPLMLGFFYVGRFWALIQPLHLLQDYFISISK